MPKEPVLLVKTKHGLVKPNAEVVSKKARRGKPIDLLAEYGGFFLKLVVPPQTIEKIAAIYRTGTQSCSPKRHSKSSEFELIFSFDEFKMG